MSSKGQLTHAATQHVPNSPLIASVVRSTAFSVQQQLPGAHQHGSSCPAAWSAKQVDGSAAAAVLNAVQQRWQTLVLERLHAAQMFLPDVPLASVPRTAQELDNLRRQGEGSSMCCMSSLCCYTCSLGYGPQDKAVWLSVCFEFASTASFCHTTCPYPHHAVY